MSLPGLLIEYLITGATAFLWLWFLLPYPQLDAPAKVGLEGIDAKTLGLMVPLAYVLGMIIDFVSNLVTRGLRFLVVEHTLWPLRKRIAAALPKIQRYLEPPERKRAPLSQHEIMLASAELGKQLEMRSSRDRVARGAFLNAVIGTIVVTTYCGANPECHVSTRAILFGGCGMSLVLFAMWHRFDWLTDKYKRKAGEAIQKQKAPQPARAP